MGTARQESDLRIIASRAAEKYPALEARANQCVLGRSGIQFSVKGLARSMSAPTRGARQSLARWGKYFRKHDRRGYQRWHNELPKGLSAWIGTDPAVHKKMPKSTSGGTVMWGLRSLIMIQSVAGFQLR
eukprot:7996027-Pyramimonas_sp.AAC.1